MPYKHPENIIRAIGVALTTDQLTELESKINSLPVKYRDALLLHYRDGLTYQRIADENGFVSPSAAWACVRTGLGRLRRMYGVKREEGDGNAFRARREYSIQRISSP